MTIEEKKAYLKTYRALGTRIHRLLEEKDRWSALATSLAPAGSAPPPRRGQRGDRLLDAVEHIVDLERAIGCEAARLAARRRAIEQSLQTILDERLRDILRFIYIDGNTIEETAERAGYSERHVRRLHTAALHVLVCPPETEYTDSVDK